MLGVLSIACLKTNLLTVPTTQYTTKDNCNLSLAKNMTNLQPIVRIMNSNNKNSECSKSLNVGLLSTCKTKFNSEKAY